MAPLFAPPGNNKSSQFIINKSDLPVIWIHLFGMNFLPAGRFFGIAHYFHLDSSQNQFCSLEQKGVAM